MTHPRGCTMAVLCYDERQAIDFGALTDALRAWLKCNSANCGSPTAHYDDLFVCDFGDTRIGFAHCDITHDAAHDHDMGGFEECVMIVISSLPDAPGPGQDFELRKDRCLTLSEHIDAQHPADEILLVDLPDPFTSALYDQLLDGLWPALAHSDSDQLELNLPRIAAG